jgi:diguanylate cyclase (GGDEF)-like protein
MAFRKLSDIPPDVYVQFVRSLFDNYQTLLVGAACHSIVAAMIYWRGGQEIYAFWAVILFAIGLARYFSLRHFHTSGVVVEADTARGWEIRYLIGGSIQGLALGIFCFTTIYVGNDPYAEFGALAITFGSIVTVVGRNYGSPIMVTIFATTFVGPIAAALMMRADVPHVVLGLMIVPFWFIIKSSAAHVRQVLFSAVIGHGQARLLAQRFDRALNTMSHGLVMLGPDGRAVVANQEAADALGFRSHTQIMGRSLRALLMRGTAAGLLSARDRRFAEDQLTRALRENRDRKILIHLSDGRYYEFSAREGRDELGVITFDEVTARVEAEDKIRFMARYDGLTELPNRAYFHEVVEETMAEGDPERWCGIAIFDLDDFKTINDTLGHPVGDGLIYAVAERLAAMATDDIKVSRFGGDEFMVFFDHVSDRDEFIHRLDDMFERIQGEVDVAGHSIRIQVSAGAVLTRPSEDDVDQMVVKADLALYKAKELGKNGWRLFEAAMDQAFRNRQILKADLRAAVEAGKLRVVYQPIVAMNSMRIASCEALCRWDHPDMGPISPGVFIPLAEEMGIISDISSFVLNEACNECLKWPEPVGVSVNLSAKDFRSREVVHRVREALDMSGLAPERLEIEVTETALLDDKASTRAYIEDLKRLGVHIALDDFGTGYSSLSYLHTLPLDKVKIDRSFLIDVTQNKRSLELLKGIVNMSRPLGLSVTVEGVETFEQLRILALEVRPELVQGFLFGAALTASGIEAMSSTVWPFTKDTHKGRSVTTLETPVLN